jgi:hypothetical protein
MTCAFNKCAKINTCVGAILLIVGGIVFLSAHLSAEAGFDIETMGGSQSFTVSVEADDWHGLYIRASAPCEEGNIFDASVLSDPVITVTHQSSNTNAGFTVSCGLISTDPETSWEADHDPPLRSVGSFMPAEDSNDCGEQHCSQDDIANDMCYNPCAKLHGTYRITCSTDCWAVDLGEEIAEAIGGIMGAMVMLIVVVILLLAGAIVCCVACCCCCKGPDDKGAPQTVQGQVVGQPVGSA